MTTANPPRQILSRLADEDFAGRESELALLESLARTDAPARSTVSRSNGLLLGAPRVGKTEILRKCFDRLFNEGGEALPFYYALPRSCADYEKFARDYFSRFLAQFVAFRRDDPKLIEAADEPLTVIGRAAPAEDYLCVRSLIDSFTSALQSGDSTALLRVALSAPGAASTHAGLEPLILLDDAHHLAVTELHAELHAELIRALGSGGTLGRRSPIYVLTGLRRLVSNLIPADQEVFDRIEVIHAERLNNEVLERATRRRAELFGIDTTDSTIELMVQQLNCDSFYIKSVLNAAASRGTSLKTFIEFERLYAGELRNGRIGYYLDELMREVAPGAGEGRAMLEALALVIEAGSPVPIVAVTERIREHTSDSEGLLRRLHSREMLEVNYGFVAAPDDPVLTDYVRARYRGEVAGSPRPVAGDELLGDRLKHSYSVMMSRYNRGIESQLVELLSRFDFQSLPASLFDHVAYEKRYRGMGRVQVRRALEDEQERVRPPQIVHVHDLGDDEQPGVSWRLYAATGFEGGIYTEANEVLWLVALINSKEPLDVVTLGRIEQRLDAALRGQRAKSTRLSHVVRWYISKEGFSAVASERLASVYAWRSTYVHLDLIQDCLTRLALSGEPRPASEFELVIPIEDEAELIAARTAEQIARAADFSQEAINHIKTALIEACINAAEHSDSPDRKIHQRFAIDEDKLIITVTNKGKTFGRANGQATPALNARSTKGARGRGFQIIRALMDEVEFERTDDGARLVMTKYLKRPEGR